ncbi:MAG TPA: VWA domain-containing protein [Pyrinomonadaceae bacterium]|nr:VWA domain-containing protein [Pyrinomonadaceae bacterium]
MRRFYPQIPLILFVTLSLFIASPAQKPAKRKALKDFGSSLKRLKWNQEKNAAVASPAQNAAAKSDDEDDVIRVDTSLVTCELLVFDRYGKPVTGLTGEDFAVVEDGASQTVGHFLLGDNINVPRTIVLIIDFSGSQLPYLKNSIAAAKVLVDKLGPNDLMAIVTDDVELIQDFTTDKKKLKKKLDGVQQQTERNNFSLGGFSLSQPRLGRSKQYSALMATLNEAFAETDVRPIIIFQTDGDEALFLRNSEIGYTVPEGLEGEALEWAKRAAANYKQSLQRDQTEFSLDDIYRAVERSRATVYTVIPGLKLLGLTPQQQLEKHLQEREFMLFGSLNQLPPDERAKIIERLKKRPFDPNLLNAQWRVMLDAKMQSALSGVAALTGGWTDFLEKPEQADGIYARIFSDINQRYIIGYYPTNKERDGKRRKIDFEVKNHPEYQIFGRRSYFAPSQ